ncbi:hypothetical protein NDU88_003033 [Pleurodeles waltl]|uniref:Nuclear factor interleukin-3-regulated protein n=1 Tax=Pleurodeles waltl TaxID=8319 RepID=A0AAV7W2B3_PLEWA|nr:hypothetical protein NDU88_003033 [Pleurodeles waltl]
MEERVSTLRKEVGEQLREDQLGLIQPGQQKGSTVSTVENQEHNPAATHGCPAPPLWASGSPLDYLGRPLLGMGPPRRRQGAPRRPREFTPEEHKEGSYWSRRQRNNEAARRSRQRRRLQELHLEARALELLRENERLRAALCALYCPPGPRVAPSLLPAPAASHHSPLPPGGQRPPPAPPGGSVTQAAPYRPWVDRAPQPHEPRNICPGAPPCAGPQTASLLPHKLRHKGRGALGALAQGPAEHGVRGAAGGSFELGGGLLTPRAREGAHGPGFLVYTGTSSLPVGPISPTNLLNYADCYTPAFELCNTLSKGQAT